MKEAHKGCAQLLWFSCARSLLFLLDFHVVSHSYKFETSSWTLRSGTSFFKLGEQSPAACWNCLCAFYFFSIPASYGMDLSYGEAMDLQNLGTLVLDNWVAPDFHYRGPYWYLSPQQLNVLFLPSLFYQTGVGVNTQCIHSQLSPKIVTDFMFSCNSVPLLYSIYIPLPTKRLLEAPLAIECSMCPDCEVS